MRLLRFPAGLDVRMLKTWFRIISIKHPCKFLQFSMYADGRRALLKKMLIPEKGQKINKSKILNNFAAWNHRLFMTKTPYRIQIINRKEVSANCVIQTE